jgi:galactose mutarotase-like enzyme
MRHLRKYCAGRMAIEKTTFELPQIGRSVDLYTLRRKGGMEAKILTLGGVVTTLTAPDRDGRMGDVVLGFDAPADYLANRPFFGALIGRYGNRIARGDLPVDGARHALATNDGPNHLHGGPGGFHTVLWEVGDVIDGDEPALALRYTSRDGEEGYPGTLVVDVCYTLTAEGGARVEYIATTDRPTVVNLTQHSYLNDTALVPQPGRARRGQHRRSPAAAGGVAFRGRRRDRDPDRRAARRARHAVRLPDPDGDRRAYRRRRRAATFRARL